MKRISKSLEHNDLKRDREMFAKSVNFTVKIGGLEGTFISDNICVRFKLHLSDILLLKVSNIFQCGAVVPLCDFGYI